ncbi:MAG TPA: DNA alkylation repair protein [Terriglobales bacterium]|nr:DNA alkylation repair protein [Terriglobales bacterium]
MALAGKLIIADLRRELAEASDPERARKLAWFFKTGKGEYGEGDRFCGITVPVQRKIARRYGHLSLGDVEKLLRSPVHEHRFTALEILVFQYERGDDSTKRRVYEFYLDHLHHVNNWDLVDTSAPFIVGDYLVSRSRRILYKLAKSPNLWERRIAIVSTMAFIAKNDLLDTFAIAARLLDDEHDLIHKAVGWMLRETGKRSQPALLDFLERNYARMPRTALRYAIERLPEAQRKRVLKGVFSKTACSAAANANS